MNKYLLALIAIIVVVASTFVALRVYSPEDTWLCVQGTWTKHGNPASPAPTSSCSNIQNNSTTTTTPPIKTNDNTGGIKGRTLLGPTCPVVRIPPDPQCADKPYQTSLIVTTADDVEVVKKFSTDAQGTFTVNLPPGDYAIRSDATTSIYPRCSNREIIKVNAKTFTDVTVYCDTGIR